MTEYQTPAWLAGDIEGMVRDLAHDRDVMPRHNVTASEDARLTAYIQIRALLVNGADLDRAVAIVEAVDRYEAQLKAEREAQR